MAAVSSFKSCQQQGEREKLASKRRQPIKQRNTEGRPQTDLQLPLFVGLLVLPSLPQHVQGHCLDRVCCMFEQRILRGLRHGGGARSGRGWAHAQGKAAGDATLRQEAPRPPPRARLAHAALALRPVCTGFGSNLLTRGTCSANRRPFLTNRPPSRYGPDVLYRSGNKGVAAD